MKHLFLFIALVTLLMSCENIIDPINTPEILPCDLEDMELTNWNAEGIDYLVECDVYVTGTMSIAPGTTIAFESEGSFIVEQNGKIEALGVGGQPITFRGVRDGVSTWKGIYINTDNTTSEFQFANFIGGGNGPNFTQFKNEIASIYLEGNMRMNNCSIKDTDGTAIWTPNEFYDAQLLSFSENTIENCGYFPLLLSVNALKYTDLASCTFKENGDNAIAITEEGAVLNEDYIFENINVPYYFLAGLVLKGNTRLEAGVAFQMRAGTSIDVTAPQALLTISGTQTKKVSIQGKLNTAGFWQGIYIANEQNHVFEHLDISDGGSSASGFNSQLANITMEFDSQLTLINCTSSRSNSTCDVVVHNFGGSPILDIQGDNISVCTE